MPRNDFYPYQKPYSQEESYLYDEYENYDYGQKPEPKPHHCCPPCPCPKPEPKPHCCCPPCPCPKPEPKPECNLITAQLSHDPAQFAPGINPALKLDTLVNVSDSDPTAPLYYKDGIITFKKAGTFIVTYGTDVHLDFSLLPLGNDVRLGLQLDGTTIVESISHARNTNPGIFGRQTLTKCVLINVYPGSKLSLVVLTNIGTVNDFNHTVLVLDEKCTMHKKCD